jgi:hypothetical protein
MSHSAGPEPSAPDGNNIRQLSELLVQALELADGMELPPEIGARLQEVLDQITAMNSSNDKEDPPIA